MRRRRFIQCDVFTSVPTKGNGLAVVVDGEGLSDKGDAGVRCLDEPRRDHVSDVADDKGGRLQGAHLHTQARDALRRAPDTRQLRVMDMRWRQISDGGRGQQQCGVGIVDIDVSGAVPAFAAPKTTIAPLPPENLEAITSALGLPSDRILRTAQLANGPVWQVLQLASAADVLAADSSKIRYPEFLGVGLIGAHPPGSECQFEARNLAPSSGMSEDPITGSLNAAIAQWMYGAGHWHDPVTIAQGTCIAREGRLFIRRDDKTGTVWVGGQTCILIEGTLTLQGAP